MSTKGFEKLFRLALIPLTAVVLVASGCTSSMTSTTQSNVPTGSAFLVGTDAPLAAVVSFQVQLLDVELTNGTTTTSTLVKGTPTVDFARFNGLQTLVDMNQVPAGTYTGVTFVLGTGTVSYLNTTGGGAPTIATAPAAFSNSTLTFNLPKSLTIGANMPPVGLRMDFDLGQSIPVDSNGNIEINTTTGDVTVTPTIDVSTVTRTDEGAHIDLLYGSVVTAPTSTTTEPSSFTIQGPHGEQFTINTSSTTEWDGGAGLSSLNTNSVVVVAGSLDPADQTLDADEVALITDSKFYARGLVTYVTPATGQATNLDFYVRAVEPSSLADVPLGGIAQVDITGKENYGIYWMHNAFTQLLFNSYALTPGQEIAVGGTDSEATPTSGTAITVNRIHLENWGYEGTVANSSQNSGQGLFQMQITGFAGQVVPSTVTVYLGPACDFRYGFGAFNDLSNGAKVRVVGLLLKNSTNGNLVLLARHIDGLSFTDTTTAAWQ